MSRVDFYVLSEGAPDAIWRCACRIIEKAFDMGHRVYVRVANTAEAQRLDDLLWTFSDRAFIPHQVLRSNEATHEAVPAHEVIRVLIGESAAPASHRDVLVNISGKLPDEIAAFTRIAEIVDTDGERKRLSRELYKQYREAGCVLDTHTL